MKKAGEDFSPPALLYLKLSLISDQFIFQLLFDAVHHFDQ